MSTQSFRAQGLTDITAVFRWLCGDMCPHLAGIMALSLTVSSESSELPDIRTGHAILQREDRFIEHASHMCGRRFVSIAG